MPDSPTNNQPLKTPQGGYDAKHGFRDIKPPPQFFPKTELSTLLAVALGVLLMILLAYYLRKRPKRVSKAATPALSPKERADSQLAALKTNFDKNSISIRDYSEELSIILRNYITAVFPINASELTRSELLRRLPPVMKAKLPNLSSEKMTKLLDGQSQLLALCEQLAFSSNSEIVFSEQKNSGRKNSEKKNYVELLPDEARQLIQEFDGLLRLEQERLESLTEPRT